ncbi:MAG: flavodoxin domain-containing protein [Chloroflexota bacterium]
MNKVLVTYATNSGTTADVARAIGEEIEKSGAQVDVLPLERVTTLAGYAAVVLGAPMIMGWHRAATAFLKKHQQSLSKVPVALFVTCISLTQSGETQVDGTAITVDPALPQAPKQPGRLSFKERYTTVGNYVRPILKAAPQAKPVSVGIFGGRLDMYRLKWWQALFVMAIIQAQPGEKRNWDAIRSWAGQLAALLH